MDQGIRPTALILADSQPHDPWTIEDKRLVVAMHLLNKQKCPKCGKPVWICRSSNNMLTFSVRTEVCYASAELEKAQAELSKRKKELKPGEFHYVVPKMLNDTPLPTRAEWIKSLADE